MAEFYDNTTRQKEIYSDIDLAFLSHPVTGKLTRKINRHAVRQSVKSLVLTNHYERPFKPDIGCTIRGLLFENFHPSIRQDLAHAIEETIINHEPRAELIDVQVDPKPDEHGINISIIFRVVNIAEPETLNILLERVR